MTKVYLVLDPPSNGKRHYLAGSQLTGHLSIAASKNFRVKNIKMQFIGTEVALCGTKGAVYGPSYCKGEHVFTKNVKVQWADPEQYRRLIDGHTTLLADGGACCLKFTLHLPSTLPTPFRQVLNRGEPDHFNPDYALIEYAMHAEVEELGSCLTAVTNHFLKTDYKNIPIHAVPPKDMTSQVIIDPKVQKVSTGIFKWIKAPGGLALGANFPSGNRVARGQQLNVVLVCRNDTNIPITSTQLTLEQRTIWRSDGVLTTKKTPKVLLQMETSQAFAHSHEHPAGKDDPVAAVHKEMHSPHLHQQDTVPTQENGYTQTCSVQLPPIPYSKSESKPGDIFDTYHGTLVENQHVLVVTLHTANSKQKQIHFDIPICLVPSTSRSRSTSPKRHEQKGAILTTVQ